MGKEPKQSAEAKPLTEKVPVPLSDREVAELGVRLAETRQRTGKLETEKRDTDQGYNAQLKTLEALQDTLAKQINERQSEIEIAVKEVPDDARKMVCIVRLDNGQLLRTREMTTKEKGEAFTRRQPGLFDKNLVPEGEHGVVEDDYLKKDPDKTPSDPPEAIDVETGVLPSDGPDEDDADDEDSPDPDAEEDKRDTERPEAPPPIQGEGEGVEHRGQHLRRVPRGHPDAPKA
jgi:hypothetical protein